MENLEFIEKVVSKAFDELSFTKVPISSEFIKLSDDEKNEYFDIVRNSAFDCHHLLFSLLEYFKLCRTISAE